MLDEKTVAIIATHGYEQSELKYPLEDLKKAGAKVCVVSPSDDPIRGVIGLEWQDATVDVDQRLESASPDGFDALVLPGGVYNPDTLRQNGKVISFVKEMVGAGKPVAAICHGPWLLAEAGVVKSRRIASYPSIRTDVTNAGATWVDEAVVVDRPIITSRTPDDLEPFCAALKEALGETMIEKRADAQPTTEERRDETPSGLRQPVLYR